MSTLKHQLPNIPKVGDPFEHCKLNRREYAEMLTNIVENYSDGFVMAIESPWGFGKTTFIKMWEQYLKQREFETLYFNAWENDFQDDIMIALLSQLKQLKDPTEKFETVLAKSGQFLSRILPSVAKGVTEKLGGEEAVSEIIKASFEFTGEEVSEYIDEYNKKRKGIEDFKLALAELVSEFERPVIFFIDELDRCKPDYAVRVLEQIKHVFSVEGIVFVLSIDKKQLKNAIKGFYGSESIDANHYLKRFIDLNFSFPKPNLNEFINYLFEYYNFKDFISHEDRRGSDEFREDGNSLKKMSILLYGNGDLSPRQITKLFSRVRLTLNSFSTRQYIFPYDIILLAYLKENEEDFYKEIEQSRNTPQELLFKLETIIEPYLSKDNLRSFTFLATSFLARYIRQYEGIVREPVKFLEKKEDGTETLSLETKYFNEELFIRILKNNLEHYNVGHIGLSFIQRRYSLLPNSN